MRRVWACLASLLKIGRALPAYVPQKGVHGRAEEQQRTLQSIVMPPTDSVQ